MQTEKQNEVLTVDEVARLLKVSRQTIYVMVRNNQIDHFRIGNSVRFTREALDRLMTPKTATETKE